MSEKYSTMFIRPAPAVVNRRSYCCSAGSSTGSSSKQTRSTAHGVITVSGTESRMARMDSSREFSRISSETDVVTIGGMPYVPPERLPAAPRGG